MTGDRARFITAVVLVAAGVAAAVGPFTFDVGTQRWLGFGAGVATVLALMFGFAARGRGVAQRLLDLPTALVGAWLMVVTRAIESTGAGSSIHAVKWLNLSAGAALLGAGLVGLLLHESKLERSLRVAQAERWPITARRSRDPEAEFDAQAVDGPQTLNERYADAVSRAAR
ncbi:MAG TPA: hypothetical protein VME01_05360 [Solirubrobacteraceae bacterium]|nr:hypothetical protein [Solirubrobacteraceae bacterium]